MSGLVGGVAAVACGLAGWWCVPALAHRLAVPRGQPARRDCARCGTPLPRGPGGWMAGRCRRGHQLGPPRWLTAATAGLSGGLLGAALGTTAVLPLLLALVALGVLLAVVDLRCQRLPDPLVLPALAASPVLLGLVAALTGQWDDWLRGLLSFLGIGLALVVLVLLPGGGFGPGDAKVGALLGWYLGWLGWDAVVLSVALPWLVHVPAVLVLLATGRAGWRTPVPFGPALLGGALLAVLVAARFPDLV